MSARIYAFPSAQGRQKQPAKTTNQRELPLIEVSVRGDSIDVEITQDNETTIVSLSSTAATDLCLILAESIEDIAAASFDGMVQ